MRLIMIMMLSGCLSNVPVEATGISTCEPGEPPVAKCEDQTVSCAELCSEMCGHPDIVRCIYKTRSACHGHLPQCHGGDPMTHWEIVKGINEGGPTTAVVMTDHPQRGSLVPDDPVVVADFECDDDFVALGAGKAWIELDWHQTCACGATLSSALVLSTRDALVVEDRHVRPLPRDLPSTEFQRITIYVCESCGLVLR